MKLQFLLLSFLFFLYSFNSHGCTSFILKTINGEPVYGRTMEWGAFDLKSELVIVPRGKSFGSMLQGRKKGLQWTNKYGYAAINALKKPFVMDGMNEKGLVVGVLYYPGFAQFQDADNKLQDKTLTNVDLANYILGTFDSTTNIKSALMDLRVVYNKDLEKAFGAPTPLHLIVSDENGKSIVIEYTKKVLTVFDNKIGVMTNAPSYDWHVLNLRNYPSLKPMGVTPGKTINGVDISPFGAGSGMMGLPGDVTPPSRFIRATAFTRSSVKLTSPDFAVKQASRILNNFDIPKGLVREPEGNSFHLNSTQWSVIGDMKNRRYYYWTEFNRRLRLVDLKKINWSADDIKTFPLDKKREEDIDEITVL